MITWFFTWSPVSHCFACEDKCFLFPHSPSNFIRAGLKLTWPCLYQWNNKNQYELKAGKPVLFDVTKKDSKKYYRQPLKGFSSLVTDNTNRYRLHFLLKNALNMLLHILAYFLPASLTNGMEIDCKTWKLYIWTWSMKVSVNFPRDQIKSSKRKW